MIHCPLFYKKYLQTEERSLNIDCKQIDTIDMSGLQLLHVWVQCVRARGVKTQLINLSESMQQTIRRLGLGQCFTDNYPDSA